MVLWKSDSMIWIKSLFNWGWNDFHFCPGPIFTKINFYCGCIECVNCATILCHLVLFYVLFICFINVLLLMKLYLETFIFLYIRAIVYWQDIPFNKMCRGNFEKFQLLFEKQGIYNVNVDIRKSESHLLDYELCS